MSDSPNGRRSVPLELSRRRILTGGAAAAGLTMLGGFGGSPPPTFGAGGDEGQFDAHPAKASCWVGFYRPGTEEVAQVVPISFSTVARGCSATEAYDPDLDRRVLDLDSKITLFFADDQRPVWLKALMAISPDPNPAALPRPLGGLAARLVAAYGPGTITVYQDPHRPVVGRVVAYERGEGGSFFPAYSYFDQYLVANVRGRTYVNKDPLRVSSYVKVWPPAGETYHSETRRKFYDIDDLQGPPAFEFGGCTIEIGTEPLTSDGLQTAIDLIGSVRASPRV